MGRVGVRYIVDDVDAAIDFYCDQLGFHEHMHPAPTFAMVSDLRANGARFRSDIITGVGGKQVLVEDPAGNPIEIFQPTRAQAKR
jgi:hypothetical protein